MTALAPVPSQPLARGDLVLAHFPFADLSSTKLRPAVIVGADSTQGDFILAFITSQQTATVASDDVLIAPAHPEFAATGLLTTSKIRASKLVTLSPRLLARRLGRLGTALTEDLDRALITALQITLSTP